MYTPPDIAEAYDEWKANCGPAALAALVGRPLAQVREAFPDFPAKPWANPTHMRAALTRLDWSHRYCDGWPERGLAFIQWEGPWLDPGVPVGAAYRHTHWVAAAEGKVFDVNAGNWTTPDEWVTRIVPLFVTGKVTGWHVRCGLEAEPGRPTFARPVNPCGCGWCNACGLVGAAPKPPPPPPALDEPAQNDRQLDSPRPVKRTPSLFDVPEATE